MPFTRKNYGELFTSAEMNAIYDSIEALQGGGGGGGSSYVDWDFLIRNDAGTYRAYNRFGASVSSSASLVTVFDAVKASGSRVHFIAGSYVATGNLSLLSDMVVTGEGYNTLISRTTSGGIFRLVGTSGTRLSNMVLSNIRLAGPSTPSSQVIGSGVFVQYADRCTVSDMWVSGFGSNGDDAGIELDDSTQIRVLRNICWNNKNGICTGAPTSTTIKCTDVTISFNECFSNYDDGIHSQRGMRTIISNNTCYNQPNGGASDGAGIDTLGDEYSTVTGNTMFNNARGLEIGNTANQSYGDIGSVYSGNIITGNYAYGVTIIASAKRCRVFGNTIENNADGIRFGSGTTGAVIEDIAIENNHIHNNGPTGIDIFGYNTRATIQNNQMSGHSSRDVYIRTSTGTPAGYVIQWNRLRSTTTVTDNVTASDRIVANNYT